MGWYYSMKNEKIYVLMLVYVDKEWMDIAGNKYPSTGLIRAKNFSIDENIQYGLVGIPWGKTDSFIYEENSHGHWIVVKTEIHNNLICTDYYANRYKFSEGVVLYSGKIDACADFIWKVINSKDNGLITESESISIEDIAGSKAWRKNKKYLSRV